MSYCEQGPISSCRHSTLDISMSSDIEKKMLSVDFTHIRLLSAAESESTTLRLLAEHKSRRTGRIADLGLPTSKWFDIWLKFIDNVDVLIFYFHTTKTCRFMWVTRSFSRTYKNTFTSLLHQMSDVNVKELTFHSKCQINQFARLVHPHFHLRHHQQLMLIKNWKFTLWFSLISHH